MADSKRAKEEMTEEYKELLAKKEAEEAKKQQDASLREMQKRQSTIKARREAEVLKKKLEEERAGKKIAECDAQIKKAEKTLESRRVYDLLGTVSLWLAAGLLLVAIMLAVGGLINAWNIVIPMIISLVILSISVYFQTLPLFAEQKIRHANTRKKEVRQALLAKKNRHK